MAQRFAIGIDIGGTKIAGCLLDDSGSILDSRLAPTPKTSASEVISEVERTIASLIAGSKVEVVGIGVATGGDVDHLTGEILSATDLIPQWKGVNLREVIQKESQRPIFVENDGSMAVYGEWKAGAAKGYRHVVGLTLGTGLGGGIIADGILLHGARGAIANFCFLRASQLIDGDRQAPNRPLEYYLSGPGIVRIAEILCGSDEQSMFSEELRRDIAGKHVGASDILQKADAGEPFALNVVGVFFDYLQHLLSIIQHILSPEIVVFGGGIISGNYDVIREKISGLSKVYPFRIQLSTLGNRAGMIGAGLYALEETKFRTT